MLFKKFEDEWSAYWFSNIKKTKEKEWNWYRISENPNITWKTIIDNIGEIQWNWNSVSQNVNVSLYHYYSTNLLYIS